MLEKWEGSNKVLRWKLDLQEYNFTLRHIPGETNAVADGLSRAVHDPYSIESLALLEVEESVAQYLYKDNDPLGESEEIATLCLASLEDMSTNIPKEYADKISDVHNNLSAITGLKSR